MKNWYVILLLCITTTAYSIEENKEINILQLEKPPINGYRIAGEILVGGAIGLLVGYAGIEMMCSNAGNGFGAIGCGLTGLYLVGIPGYMLGSAIGVYFAGLTDDETGSFWATLGGSIFGGFFGILPAPIGATIGFNLTRKYTKPPASGNSLINFRDSKMSLAVPTIHLNPNPYEAKTLVLNVDLVKVRF